MKKAYTVNTAALSSQSSSSACGRRGRGTTLGGDATAHHVQCAAQAEDEKAQRGCGRAGGGGGLMQRAAPA